jgi:hypothetical protein
MAPRIIALAVLMAGLSQAAERVFKFVNTGSAHDAQELATTVRSIAEIRQAFADAEARSMRVQATEEQIALAEWLTAQLDRRPGSPGASSGYEMRLPDGTAQTVRVFYFPAMERQQAQELTTVVRSIGEIRSSFLYYGARALAIRGTPAQIALTEWLLSEIRRTGPSDARDFQLDGKGEDVVQVFHLPSSYSVERLQQITTATRTSIQIRRMFTFNATRAIAARGSADQIASAARLLAAHQ